MSKKTMKDIWKELCKQHGEEGLYIGTDEMIADVEVLSTGSPAFDAALGVWGLPKGRLVQYAGSESSGKTFMALMAIKQMQEDDPDAWALFINAEFSFTKEWAAMLGVDLDRLMILSSNKGTEIFEKLLGKPKKNKVTGMVTIAKKGLLQLEKETPSGLGIIVLDSVASIMPPAEEASASGKQNMALLARFLPPELRKLMPLLADTGVTFIAINQVRTDPGKMFGDPTTTPGGQTWKHHCSIMAMFGAMTTKAYCTFDEFGDQTGHKIKIKIQKNNVAPPFRTAEVGIVYTHGLIGREEEIRDIGARYGIIERPSSKTWILDGEKYNGKDAMAQALLDGELQKSVLERAKVAKKEYKVEIKPKSEEDLVNADEEQNNDADV